MATSSVEDASFAGRLFEQDDVDALREGVGARAGGMETEVSSQIGAARYERTIGQCDEM